MVKSSPYDRLDEEKSTTPCSGKLSLEDLTDLVAGGTVDTVLVEMNTVNGDEMSRWRRGNGDMAMIPDLGTLRRAPWLPGAALVTADLQWLDNRCVVTSPRQILKVQLARLTLMAKFNERAGNSCRIHINLRRT